MGKIVLEDFNGGNGYYKVNLAYLNNEQVEEIENLVSKWNPTDEDIKSCIRMCLTGVNEQRFTNYNTNLKECLAWLEKQSKPIDKEKVQIGARTDIALSIMDFLDRNTLGMCLSNMERFDLEDAVVNSDWAKVYDYMKKKLEKQDKQETF